MHSEVGEYEYKPRWRQILGGGFFFGVAAAFAGVRAATNDRGLIINGLIKLGPEGATIFYWILTAGSLAFVVASVFTAFHRLTFRQRLAFGLTAVTVPVGRWSRRETELAYEDVLMLEKAKISGQHFLYVTHARGKHTIYAGMLASDAVFDEVSALLAQKVRDARRQRHPTATGQ